METTLTASEAQQLFEEKIQRLRTEQGQVERARNASVEERDKAEHEVRTLQKEKADLIEEIASLKSSKDQITHGLAEHRKNVESSLNKQETEAQSVIDQAIQIQAKIAADRQAVQQLRAQLTGIKDTLRTDIATLPSAITTLVQKTLDALTAIPD